MINFLEAAHNHGCYIWTQPLTRQPPTHPSAKETPAQEPKQETEQEILQEYLKTNN